MLTKSKRLNLKKDFQWVRGGKKFYTGEFTVFLREASVENSLIGIALSKHNFKGAVDKNRARRLTSKALEILYPTLRKGIKLVIIPKASVLQKSPEELANLLSDVKDIFITH